MVLLIFEHALSLDVIDGKKKQRLRFIKSFNRCEAFMDHQRIYRMAHLSLFPIDEQKGKTTFLLLTPLSYVLLPSFPTSPFLPALLSLEPYLAILFSSFVERREKLAEQKIAHRTLYNTWSGKNSAPHVRGMRFCLRHV